MQFARLSVCEAPNLIALKREMEFLDHKVEAYRHCVYSGQQIDEYVEWSVLQADASLGLTITTRGGA